MNSVRRLSGVRATGRLHLGNYLGALKQWSEGQGSSENYFFIADLHGLTDLLPNHDSSAFRRSRLNTAATFLAAGIDPTESTLFLQSAIPFHTELMWYMSAVARKSELERMTQWKDKKGKSHSASAALFLYPTLMAADILLYAAGEVPVGDDQRQHVEIARDWAIRFNHHLGETLVVPNAVVPAEGSRVMDLANPKQKMSKSASADDGVIFLDDSDDAVRRKVKRAVTDSVGDFADDPSRPGIANLVRLYCSISGRTYEQVVSEFQSRGYGAFKGELSDALVEVVQPIRTRTEALLADPNELARLLDLGTDRAYTVAERTCTEVREALGLGDVNSR